MEDVWNASLCQSPWTRGLHGKTVVYREEQKHKHTKVPEVGTIISHFIAVYQKKSLFPPTENHLNSVNAQEDEAQNTARTNSQD